jgi:hypothetical protein
MSEQEKKAVVMPQDATSPKDMLSDLEVVINMGQDDFALAVGLWAGNPMLLLRWTGSPDRPLGNPSSFQFATWLVIPRQLEAGIVQSLDIKQQNQVRNFFAKHS